MNELERSLNEHIENEVVEEKERFKIENDEQAEWALRKIIEAENEEEKVNQFAETQIRQIENWRAKHLEKTFDDKEYFNGLLSEYLHSKRQEDKDFKSITLPSGNVGYRKNRDKWVYNDEQVLKTLESENLNEYIKVEKKYNKNEVKRVLQEKYELVNGKFVNKETGQVIEGVEVQEQGESLNVRLNK